MIRLAPDQEPCGEILVRHPSVPGTWFMGVHDVCQRPKGHDGDCVSVRVWNPRKTRKLVERLYDIDQSKPSTRGTHTQEDKP